MRYLLRFRIHSEFVAEETDDIFLAKGWKAMDNWPGSKGDLTYVIVFFVKRASPWVDRVGGESSESCKACLWFGHHAILFQLKLCGGGILIRSDLCKRSLARDLEKLVELFLGHALRHWDLYLLWAIAIACIHSAGSGKARSRLEKLASEAPDAVDVQWMRMKQNAKTFRSRRMMMRRRRRRRRTGKKEILPRLVT